MAIALTGLVFLAIGLALGGGGIWLAWLGGSWYYVIAGLGFLLTAALLYRRKGAALWVYAVLVVGTLGWAVWEIGFDWWQLGAARRRHRALALWLLTPWIRRRGLAGPTGSAAAALARRAGLACRRRLFDDRRPARSCRRAQRREGRRRPPISAATCRPANGIYYGRTPYGQRYSPLDQITTDNVATLQPAWTYQTGDVQAAGRCRRDHLSGDAAEGRRHALHLHAAQFRHRASTPRPARRNGASIPSRGTTTTASTRPAAASPIMPTPASPPASPAPNASTCRPPMRG